MEKLIADIENAFATATYPGDGGISVVTYDDERTSEYFRGNTWRGHTAKQLRALAFSLTVFTAEAFAYFLPAYMIGDIEAPKDADTIPEALLFHLSPSIAASPERARKVISILSAAQRRATAAYFEYVRARDGECESGEFDEALELLAHDAKSA